MERFRQAVDHDVLNEDRLSGVWARFIWHAYDVDLELRDMVRRCDENDDAEITIDEILCFVNNVDWYRRALQYMNALDINNDAGLSWQELSATKTFGLFDKPYLFHALELSDNSPLDDWSTDGPVFELFEICEFFPRIDNMVCFISKLEQHKRYREYLCERTDCNDDGSRSPTLRRDEYLEYLRRDQPAWENEESTVAFVDRVFSSCAGSANEIKIYDMDCFFFNGFGIGKTPEDPLRLFPLPARPYEYDATLMITLYPDAAPLAVASFKEHAKLGRYDGIAFHRIINDFIIQGGDVENGQFSPSGLSLEAGQGGYSSFYHDIGDENDSTTWRLPDEFDPEYEAQPGALCMASDDDKTGGSQFFLLENPDMLRSEERTTMFGLATAGQFKGDLMPGIDVIRKISRVPTNNTIYDGRPIRDVPTIQKMEIDGNTATMHIDLLLLL